MIQPQSVLMGNPFRQYSKAFDLCLPWLSLCTVTPAHTHAQTYNTVLCAYAADPSSIAPYVAETQIPFHVRFTIDFCLATIHQLHFLHPHNYMHRHTNASKKHTFSPPPSFFYSCSSSTLLSCPLNLSILPFQSFLRYLREREHMYRS